MPSVQQQRDKLIGLLKQLFQLDQPDLDFGFYKIMHAKSEQVQRFLENDLLDIIKKEFGELDGDRIAIAKAKYEAAIEQAKKYGAPNPEETDAVKEAKAEYENAKEGGSPEGDIYDHLWRFFERYYDNGDFLSRRYYARETAGKAAPYAIPYDGREVYLHWANKDQYYIKTSEYLSNFTFNPAKSEEYLKLAGELLPKDEQGLEILKVHCRIVEASEGEHGNIKTSEGQQRFFIIHETEPLKLENGELTIQFQYRPDPEKSGQDNTWKQKRLTEAVDVIMAALKKNPQARIFLDVLNLPAPTEKQKDRPLLAKYLNQYAARNTMDYFIHKDLGGFLNRELDFYIKNEIMRLDDIENAEALKVENYLKKIRVLRKIARHLIEFLAQLEDFQKKIWLKKKFVTETNYCISLDRIPEEYYPEIAENEKQRQEWQCLNFISEDEKIDADFLKKSPCLLVDTAFFGKKLKAEIISRFNNFDSNNDGVLIHADNFHALNLVKAKYAETIKCVYIDPPYNTGSSLIPYKNSYRHSSWGTLMRDRLAAIRPLASQDGAIFVSIDKTERTILEHALDSVFGRENRIEELVWAMNTTNSQVPNYSTNHEYVEVYAKHRPTVEKEQSMFREPKPGYEEVMALISALNPDYPPIKVIEDEIKKLYKKHIAEYREEIESQGLDWETEKKNDPWKGLYNYCHAEYRDSKGIYVSESEATERKAHIWVWQEDNTSMPASKQAESTRDPNHKNYRFYNPPHPITGKPCPHPKSGWKFPYDADDNSPDRRSLVSLDKDYRIAWGEDEKKVPRIKRMLHEVETNIGKSVFQDYSDGEKQTSALFGKSGIFLAPKHADFVSRFILHAGKNDAIVLDCFGGSGSTGHAVIKLNREDQGKRKYLLVEMGNHFDTVMKPRLQKIIYSRQWSRGKPLAKNGSSHFFKYLRLESYEDALNNLTLGEKAQHTKAVGNSEMLRHDYMVKYWLDFETQGSPSLLNIDQFSDPTAYTLKVKKAGTDEYEDKNIDLIETFNWLIGLHVEHMDIWRNYEAGFKREKDPELPQDGNTKLVIDGKLKETDNGKFAFRKIEGWVCKTPGNTEDREKVLVVWRKLSGNLEEDNAVLDEWFRKLDIRSRDTEFDIIYVNGSNNLPNLRREDEHWKVRLLEETFHQKMWDIEDV